MGNENITEKQYQDELIECVKQFNQSELYIQNLDRQLRILEAENAYLSGINKEYERKLSLIVNNPFYKAGIKLYHIFVMLRQKR